jgi:hypothetical protein
MPMKRVKTAERKNEAAAIDFFMSLACFEVGRYKECGPVSGRTPTLITAKSISYNYDRSRANLQLRAPYRTGRSEYLDYSKRQLDWHVTMQTS